VLKRVSTHPADKIDELLPSQWTKPDSDDKAIDKAKIVKVALQPD
jgi:hypothetical protein